MDSILTNELFFMFEEESPEITNEKISLWVVEGDIIRPSTSISLLQKLQPGIYKVEVNRDYGVYCKKAKITSDELFLFSDSIIPSLVKEINLFWEKADSYKANNLVHKRGILLSGYPGGGKTSAISLLCDEVIKRNGIAFIITDPGNLGVYTNFIKNSLRQIESETPIITIIEDLDNYIDSDTILDFLDGKSQIEHHVVIATTNNTTRIPDSFLRPSRIDLKYELELPSISVRKEYFLKKSVEESYAKHLSEKTDNFTLADLKELYIAIFLLDYSLEDALEKITSTEVKKDFSTKRMKTSRLGV